MNSKNHNYFKTTFAILLILALSSCNSSGGQDITYIDFNTGGQGLVLTGVGGIPPSEVREGMEYPISVELKNKGNWKITNAKLFIGGFDTDFTKITKKDVVGLKSDLSNPINFESMNGRSYINAEGDYALVNYKIVTGKSNDAKENKELPAKSSAYVENFFVKACYGYETYAIATVCVDPGFNERIRLDKQSCTVQKSQSLSPQGGPIGVSNFNQEMQDFGANEKIVTFDIYIKNFGKGNVYSTNSYELECTPGSKANVDNLKEIKDKVEVAAFLGDDNKPENQLDCSNGDAKLGDNKKNTNYYIGRDSKIVCTKHINPSEGTFQTILKVKMRYGYSDEIKYSVTVKPLATESGESGTIEDYYQGKIDELKKERTESK